MGNIPDNFTAVPRLNAAQLGRLPLGANVEYAGGMARFYMNQLRTMGFIAEIKVTGSEVRPFEVCWDDQQDNQHARYTNMEAAVDKVAKELDRMVREVMG